MTIVDPTFEKHARERARYLAEAYDIDPDTREAFVHDVTLELIQVASGFMEAVNVIGAANASLLGEGANRQVRRALNKKMRQRGR